MMTQSQDIVTRLKRLSDLDMIQRRLGPGSPELPIIIAEVNSVRDRLPTAMLKHFDERSSRGKPAIASVRGGICGGCHLSLPSGRMAELRRADGTLYACDNCGVILVFAEETQELLPPSAPKARRSPAMAKKKTLTNVADS
jgi:RNase P subunit RPR2